MESQNRLSFNRLKNNYDPRKFRFGTTEELRGLEDFIGQERAVKAMEFGLNVKNSKYNIFLCGIKGTGKTTYCISKTKEKAKTEKRPDDWCYVYDFKEPDKPKAINLPAGMGKVFREDMETLVRDLLSEAPKVFLSEEYENNKNHIMKKFKENKLELLNYLNDYGMELGFEINTSSTGLIFVPIKDGKKLSDEEYEELDEDERGEYERNAEKLQIKAMEILKKVQLIEKDAKRKLVDFQKITAHFVLKPIIDELLAKYNDFDDVVEYIKDVKEDIVENITELEVLAEEDIIANSDIKNLIPRYYVNLIVDNSNLEGAPVVVESNPTYNNLVGMIEYENEKGTLRTDFTMIKAGSIHRANGGYLIIQAEQLLRNSHSWATLKRVLNTGEISIESLRYQLGITDIAILTPQPIPVKFKLILIGSPYIYQLLSMYDEDFHKLFKIKVDFDSTMDNTYENQIKVASFISSFCENEDLKPFNKFGVIKVLEFSNRLAESQNKLSTRFDKIVEILIEADAWANYDGSRIVTEKHVERAIREKIYRNNRIQERIEELFKNGKIVIDVKGKKIGRINGLSVINTGDHTFGKPSVITVSSYKGNKGVINIEREVEMSGSVHDKGVMILEGYLNERFGRLRPLNVTSKICFEQSYNEVDGDSASSTELYGILSSIGNFPLKQNIATTGSVNQKGEIQPVGGINEKIEGFYNVCKYLGLTGNQGVIIPVQNMDDLVLCDEVINAVKKGMFHIYAVATIEEGLEILTDKSFSYIYRLLEDRLMEYNKSDKIIDD